MAVILACLAIVMTTCFVEAAAMSNSSGAIEKEDEDGESEHAVILASLSWQSHHLNSFEGRCRLANRRTILSRDEE